MMLRKIIDIMRTHHLEKADRSDTDSLMGSDSTKQISTSTTRGVGVAESTRKSIKTKILWHHALRACALLGKGLQNTHTESLILEAEHWLEATEAKHRYGSNLRPYFDYWLTLQDGAGTSSSFTSQGSASMPPSVSSACLNLGDDKERERSGFPGTSHLSLRHSGLIRTSTSPAFTSGSAPPSISGATGGSSAPRDIQPLVTTYRTHERFFKWLDEGPGRFIDLADQGCPRTRLESQKVKYLTPEELLLYEIVVDPATGLFRYKVSGEVVHTTLWGDHSTAACGTPVAPDPQQQQLLLPLPNGPSAHHTALVASPAPAASTTVSAPAPAAAAAATKASVAAHQDAAHQDGRRVSSGANATTTATATAAATACPIAAVQPGEVVTGAWQSSLGDPPGALRYVVSKKAGGGRHPIEQDVRVVVDDDQEYAYTSSSSSSSGEEAGGHHVGGVRESSSGQRLETCTEEEARVDSESEQSVCEAWSQTLLADVPPAEGGMPAEEGTGLERSLSGRGTGRGAPRSGCSWPDATVRSQGFLGSVGRASSSVSRFASQFGAMLPSPSREVPRGGPSEPVAGLGGPDGSRRGIRIPSNSHGGHHASEVPVEDAGGHWSSRESSTRRGAGGKEEPSSSFLGGSRKGGGDGDGGGFVCGSLFRSSIPSDRPDRLASDAAAFGVGIEDSGMSVIGDGLRLPSNLESCGTVPDISWMDVSMFSSRPAMSVRKEDGGEPQPHGALLRRWSAAVDRSASLLSSTPPPPRKWIYVVDTQQRMFVHYKYRGCFHHSSFLRGAPVLAAGNLIMEQGRLVKLTPDSGHYRPSSENFRWLVNHLKSLGADLSQATLTAKHVAV